jgi:hypothetical protein
MVEGQRRTEGGRYLKLRDVCRGVRIPPFYFPASSLTSTSIDAHSHRWSQGELSRGVFFSFPFSEEGGQADRGARRGGVMILRESEGRPACTLFGRV